MQTVETQNEGLKRAYRMTITAKDVESRIDAEVKKIAPQVRMPGFRPGKVPANLVKKMHKDSLLQDALNSSIQDGVQKAIADNKLRPATQPHVHLDHEYAPGKDAVVDFHFEVLPIIPAVVSEIARHTDCISAFLKRMASCTFLRNTRSGSDFHGSSLHRGNSL